jgi:dTDP-4-dehydrorhamnose reductase
VKGYTKAIYSGLTTPELARVVADYVLPNPQLTGLYHLSVDPISKHDLLALIAQVYGKKIDIAAEDTVSIDRSLDSARFRRATGYAPDDWTGLVRDMYNDYLSCPYYRTYDDTDIRKGTSEE